MFVAALLHDKLEIVHFNDLLICQQLARVPLMRLEIKSASGARVDWEMVLLASSPPSLTVASSLPHQKTPVLGKRHNKKCHVGIKT